MGRAWGWEQEARSWDVLALSRAYWWWWRRGLLPQGQRELSACWLPHFHFLQLLAVRGDRAGLLPLVPGGAWAMLDIWVAGRKEPARAGGSPGLQGNSFLAVGPQASPFASLSLHFLVGKLSTVPASHSCQPWWGFLSTILCRRHSSP